MQKSPEDLSGTFYLQYSFLQRVMINYTSPTLTLVSSSPPSSPTTVMTTMTYTGVQWFGKWFCLDDVCQYTH